MFYSSPRNSVAAHTHLLEAVECKIILVPDPQPAMIPSILAAFPLKVVKAPSVDELLNKTYPPYPFTKSFEQAKLDPLIVFHTSGSTGLPKPVTWNHDYAAAYFSMIQLDPPPGCKCPIYLSKSLPWAKSKA
jgi:acyl-coenzyme A synthetase/AMP-(fatty) acid ligase